MLIDLKVGEKSEKVKITVRQNEKGVYEYYMENVKIGVYSPKSMEENILFLDKVRRNEYTEQIKDVINSKTKEEIHEEAKETKAIDTYMRSLGERDASKYKIRIIELEENEIEEEKEESEITEEKEEKEKEQNEREKEINEEQDEELENDVDEDLDEEKEEKSKITTKDVNIKQTIDLFERANDMKSMKQWLGTRIPENAVKLGVIESDDMNKMQDENGNSYQRNSTRYSLVLINSDLQVEPLNKYIPELQQHSSAGNNPTKEDFQVDKDGNVEKDAVLSEYEIENKIIQIDNEEMGDITVNIGKEERAGTDTLTIEVRDSNDTSEPNIGPIKTIREYGPNGENTVEKGIEEAEKHLKNDPNCDEMTYEDIDGDLETKSDHVEEEIEQAVEKILENEKISEIYNRADIKEKLEKALGEGVTLEEATKKVEEDMEDETDNEHPPKGLGV